MSFIICSWGVRSLRAWISLSFLTFYIVSYFFFMHLMATSLWVLMDCAMKTSENVPSPFLDYRRYWSIPIELNYYYSLLFIHLLFQPHPNTFYSSQSNGKHKSYPHNQNSTKFTRLQLVFQQDIWNPVRGINETVWDSANSLPYMRRWEWWQVIIWAGWWERSCCHSRFPRQCPWLWVSPADPRQSFLNPSYECPFSIVQYLWVLDYSIHISTISHHTPVK